MWIYLSDKSSARQIALLGVMFGIVIVLTTIEHFLVLPFMPPHAKPGLANIVVMYCVFSVGRKQAATLNILKSLFVLITRGAVAGFLSFSGGMLSITVIILLAGIKRNQASYLAISVSGALAHNMGQFMAMMFLLSMPALIYYIPLLMITGVVTGVLTGTLLKVLMPVLKKI